MCTNNTITSHEPHHTNAWSVVHHCSLQMHKCGIECQSLTHPLSSFCSDMVITKAASIPSTTTTTTKHMYINILQHEIIEVHACGLRALIPSDECWCANTPRLSSHLKMSIPCQTNSIWSLLASHITHQSLENSE